QQERIGREKRERERMSKIWELMHQKDTVVIFDVDGTLTSYSYGEYHAHHELDYTPRFREVNIYADCRRLAPIYEYIREHGTDRIFCISREPHGHEKWKSEMLGRLYGIPESHCFYTLNTDEKPAIAKHIVDVYFPEISPKSVICMDDNDVTLGQYMKETDFCTAHPMIFMEHM
nr:HAD family acid phosphatase [Lachnospiraceae bacterium]